MRNLTFGFFDDSGLPRDSRILMFYSFDTDENLPRSGILHYHLDEGRFVGPRHDRELTAAALRVPGERRAASPPRSRRLDALVDGLRAAVLAFALSGRAAGAREESDINDDGR